MLSLVLVALVLLVAEGGTRLLLTNPARGDFFTDTVPGMLIPHPERGHAYARNLDLAIETDVVSLHLRTNSRGLRGPEIGPKMGRPRVLAVGNSFTFRFGIETEDTWPAQLAGELAQHGHPVDMVDAGVSGYGAAQFRSTVEELVPELRPDLVVVGVYANGIDRLSDPYTYFAGYAARASEIPHMAATETGFLRAPFASPAPRSVALFASRYSYFAANAP